VKALRRFLADSADLVFDLLRAVGLRGPRWEFRKQALRRKLTGVSADLENVRRSVRAEHKMCRECRTLMPASAKVCPECGASTRGIPRGGFGRLIGLLFPGFASVTSIVVVLNFAFFVLSLLLSPGRNSPDALGLPAPSSYALWMLGEKFGLVTLPSDLKGYHQLYRLVMPTLLHGGVLHILFNTYALMNLGPLVEHLAGRRRFCVVYVTTGVAAFLLSAIMVPVGFSVGASGSLFGLMGFLLVFGRMQGGAAGRALSAHLMRWVFLAVIISLAPRVDFWAHAGGFGAGALLALTMRSGSPRVAREDRLLSLACALALAVVGVALLWLLLDWGRNQQLWPYIEQAIGSGYLELPVVAPPR
jgi:rhomboid protease GluP